MDPRRQKIRDAIKARDQAIEATYDAIAAAIRDGLPVNDAAAESGYHRNHVARICRKRGVPDARLRPKSSANPS